MINGTILNVTVPATNISRFNVSLGANDVIYQIPNTPLEISINLNTTLFYMFFLFVLFLYFAESLEDWRSVIYTGIAAIYSLGILVYAYVANSLPNNLYYVPFAILVIWLWIATILKADRYIR